jgi:hypothetical protein
VALIPASKRIAAKILRNFPSNVADNAKKLIMSSVQTQYSPVSPDRRYFDSNCSPRDNEDGS